MKDKGVGEAANLRLPSDGRRDEGSRARDQEAFVCPDLPTYKLTSGVLSALPEFTYYHGRGRNVCV